MQAVATAEFIQNIPAPIRERLHLKAGTVMDFDETAPYLKAVPASAPDTAELAQFQDWLRESTGLAAGKFTTDERMRETREQPDILAAMMSCVGAGRNKGSMPNLTAADWLEATRGPVELPPSA